MPRLARAKSRSGVYHIVVRGINRQDIFYDDEDRGVYLDRLARYKKECGFEIYAYCLMSNHVHLLLKEGKQDIAVAMKKIGASYVYWYNWKYERVGHLFQDRYKSEPVEDDLYFLTVARYIHNNPIKAQIENDLEKYKWSSYIEYSKDKKIVDVDRLLGMFEDKADFEVFMKEDIDDICMEIEERKRLNDDEVKLILKKISKKSNPMQIQEMNIQQRNEILRKLKEIDGVSIQQLERITGINRNVIQRS